MIGVLVRKDGKNIEKNQYEGDVDSIISLIERDRERNPGKLYVIYHDSQPDWSEFETAEIEEKETEEKRQWRLVKSDPVKALSFLAKRLGLE